MDQIFETQLKLKLSLLKCRLSSKYLTFFFSTQTDLLRGESPNLFKNIEYVANINNYYIHTCISDKNIKPNRLRVTANLVIFFFCFFVFLRKCAKREISKTTKNKILLKALILNNL